MSTETLLKICILVMFIVWQLYWNITAKIAEREKPKTKNPDALMWLKMYSIHIFGIIMLIQLIGVDILSFHASASVVFLGFLISLGGILFSVSARVTLSHNWTHAFEYQIKRGHELVTDGLYAYVRHPIYTGLLLAFTGAEIAFHSYLFIVFFLILFLMFNRNAAKEEALLKSHFGQKYEFYMKNTSRFLPFIY